jgi:hypothetical protein
METAEEGYYVTFQILNAPPGCPRSFVETMSQMSTKSTYQRTVCFGGEEEITSN